MGGGQPDRDARRPDGGPAEAEARLAAQRRPPVRRFAGGRVPDAEHPADGGRRAVAVDGRKLVIVRSGNERFACEDRCLHVGVRLSAAIQRDTVLECRWHHWRYDLRTGTVDAEDSPFECFTTYPVRVEDGDLVIDPTPRTSIRRKAWDIDRSEQCGGAT